MMGAGYRLNQRTIQIWTVDCHELWVLDPDNAKTAGISQTVYDHLLTLAPSSGMDEIRMAASRSDWFGFGITAFTSRCNFAANAVNWSGSFAVGVLVPEGQNPMAGNRPLN